MNNGNFDRSMYSSGQSAWATPTYSNNNNSGWQPQLTTNVVLVTSLEDALMRSNTRNSDMMYVHQDQPIIYRVKVDLEGRKSWAQFPYSIPDQNANVPATKADIQELLTRIETLEAAYTNPKEKKEMNINAESNG